MGTLGFILLNLFLIGITGGMWIWVLAGVWFFKKLFK